LNYLHLFPINFRSVLGSRVSIAALQWGDATAGVFVAFCNYCTRCFTILTEPSFFPLCVCVRCSNYAELDDATLIVGTILAQSYITMTGANVQGATISLGAAVTLTGSAVRLPSMLSSSGPSHTTYSSPVNMLSASNFAILAGSALTSSGLCFIRGDVGCYPTAMAAGQPVGAGGSFPEQFC
jgi:hypothetical protein